MLALVRTEEIAALLVLAARRLFPARDLHAADGIVRPPLELLTLVHDRPPNHTGSHALQARRRTFAPWSAGRGAPNPSACGKSCAQPWAPRAPRSAPRSGRPAGPSGRAHRSTRTGASRPPQARKARDAARPARARGAPRRAASRRSSGRRGT